MIATTTPLPPWRPPLPHLLKARNRSVPGRQLVAIQAFRRGDVNDAWRKAWRSANDGFEKLLYEAKKTAERIDRQYSVSRRVSSVAQSAVYRAREIDREFEIGMRWRAFSVDLSRNWPRYQRQLREFLDTPLGRSFATIFFVWFALSGWLFRFLIFATWILPFAGPLLIGTLANNLVIKGACPACQRQFVGAKNQIIRCTNCGNIVWQPKGDFYSKGGRGSSSSKSEPDVIDVEFEEK